MRKKSNLTCSFVSLANVDGADAAEILKGFMFPRSVHTLGNMWVGDRRFANGVPPTK